MESTKGDGSSNRDYKADRIWIAVAYFILPTLVCLWVGLYKPAWFSPENPVHQWRFFFCWLASFWGLAFRAFHLREKYRTVSPWSMYVTVDPLALLMIGSAVFTVLSLFENALQGLFWTAAFPLCTVLGFYVRPNEWILIEAVRSRLK